MHAASLVKTPSIPAPIAVAGPRADDTHALDEAIATLAARIHAATYELLAMLAEFDRRHGWNTGFLSCAHWLHWRTGIDLGAAREKVRVARALPALPRIGAAMARGQVSYAKVRALTRVATPENETALLDVALAGTAAHVERFVRAWRRVDDTEANRSVTARHLNRQLATWVDDDGMVVIRGRLSPEVGALVQRALEAASDRLFCDGRGVAPGDSVAGEVTPAQRRADALGLMAEAALGADLDAGSAGDRYQVVVHVSAETPAASIGGQGEGAPAAATAESVVELDHGALHVSAETSRRLACDSAVVRMSHDADGALLSVGRKTRSVPPAIRRALAARDRQCQFPGCASRRCDAHHIQHWADGGSTSLDNLVLLCRRHHTAVHEGGFSVDRLADGSVVFTTPLGRAIPAAPEVRPVARHGLDMRSDVESSPVWDGARFDVTWAIDVLYRPKPFPREEENDEEDCGSCGNRSVVSKELVGALP